MIHISKVPSMKLLGIVVASNEFMVYSKYNKTVIKRRENYLLNYRDRYNNDNIFHSIFSVTPITTLYKYPKFLKLVYENNSWGESSYDRFRFVRNFIDNVL